MGILDGKVAIVTGGGQGIGKEVALRLAGEGASVVVNSVRDGSCGAVAEEIQARGGKATAVAGDASDPAVVERIIEAATKGYGGLHILVNNAGVTRDNLLMRMKDDEWDDIMRINLRSVYLLSKAAIRPMMKNRWGRIINISSIVGVIGNAGQTNYCAAKAGIIGFTKALAREVASRNVLVNAIAPGFIQTAMTDAIPAEHREKMIGQIPVERLGTPADIAGPVLFLCSEDSAYITGATLEVAGGLGM